MATFRLPRKNAEKGLRQTLSDLEVTVASAALLRATLMDRHQHVNDSVLAAISGLSPQ
jgi:hypothetical protein